MGKFFNIINPNHRHDEEHEQETDRKRSAIAESHRFDSFAPVHEGNRVKWYVDAMDYMWAVSEALEKATETIYIADWWLSPELFMRRPPVEHQEWRLDQVLKRRAEAGVKIYVIVYKEVGLLLSVYSGRTILIFAGQPSPDLQFGAHETCAAEPLPRGKSWLRQHSSDAPP